LYIFFSEIQTDGEEQKEEQVDATIAAHERHWQIIDGVYVDPNSNLRYTHEARLKWQLIEAITNWEHRTLSSYFYLCFPMQYVAKILQFTNANIESRNLNYQEVSIGELFRWIGIKLMTVIEPRKGGISSYWSTTIDNETGYGPGHYFERFLMSKNRFEVILNNISFGPAKDPMTNGDCDPWFPIRGLIDAFNYRMAESLEPGPQLCVDECMSSWKGMSSEIAGIFGVPHVTKIARKPEGVGTELKSIADGSTGALLRLDIMEGKRRNSQKEFANFGAGTAQVLRLSKNYFGSGRLIIGDSAFSSVKTCLECKARGLFYAGVVKSAHKQFPKAYLTNWLENHKGRNNRGKFILMRTTEPAKDTIPQQEIFALGWSDKKGKQFIFNSGTTLDGNPSVRKRHRSEWNDERHQYEFKTYEKVVNRPKIVEDIFKSFSVIDIHDHLRQGSLAIERQWNTNKWPLRLFQTVLGMIITNAYLLMRYEYRIHRHGFDQDQIEFPEFLGKLARQLIFNVYLEDRVKLRNRLVFNPEEQIREVYRFEFLQIPC